MATKHECKDSDHIAKLAQDFGLKDWQTLWKSNSDLQSKRAQANLLFKGDKVAKGDVVRIPNPLEKLVDKATGKSHKFTTADPRVFLRLRILKDDYTAVKNAKFTLQVDGVDLPPGQTNDKGQIEVEVARTAQKAVLIVRVPGDQVEPPKPASGGGGTAAPAPGPADKNKKPGEVPVTWNLQIGALNPILETAPTTSCVSGVQQRLNNLSINTGPVDGLVGPNTRSALAAFCTIFGMKVESTPTKAIQQKLKEVHDDPDSVLGPKPDKKSPPPVPPKPPPKA